MSSSIHKVFLGSKEKKEIKKKGRKVKGKKIQGLCIWPPLD